MRTAKETSEAAAWLLSGDKGLSSEALLASALDPESDKWDYPSDPADLGRCLRMFRVVPWARRGLSVLAAKSPWWKRLAEHWDELAALMEEEVGLDWEKGRRASRTYDAMQDVLYPTS